MSTTQTIDPDKTLKAKRAKAKRGETTAAADNRRRGVVERWRAGEVTPSKLKRYHLPFWPIQAATVGVDQGADVSAGVEVLTDLITLKPNQIAALRVQAEARLADLEAKHDGALAVRLLEDFDRDPALLDLGNPELDDAREEVERIVALGIVNKTATRLATEMLTDALGDPAYGKRIEKAWPKIAAYTPTEKTRFATAEAGYVNAAESVPVFQGIYLLHLHANPATSMTKQIERELIGMFKVAAAAAKARQPVGAMPLFIDAEATINGPDSRAAEQREARRQAKSARRARNSEEAAANAQARNPEPREATDGK